MQRLQSSNPAIEASHRPESNLRFHCYRTPMFDYTNGLLTVFGLSDDGSRSGRIGSEVSDCTA